MTILILQGCAICTTHYRLFRSASNTWRKFWADKSRDWLDNIQRFYYMKETLSYWELDSSAAVSDLLWVPASSSFVTCGWQMLWWPRRYSPSVLWITVFTCTVLKFRDSKIFLSSILRVKIHIFWEGHKILWNLPLTFDCMYCSQSKGKILRPSQNVWTLI